MYMAKSKFFEWAAELEIPLQSSLLGTIEGDSEFGDSVHEPFVIVVTWWEFHIQVFAFV